jgi:cytochrome c biogenesis protein CcmG/thiol:disulfide interchange protein DsbE
MRRLVYVLPLIAFALVAAYLVLGLRHDPSLLPSALLDKPAPAFDLPGLEGKPALAKSDLAGRVVLVNFFASWCAPCRVEHPLLMRLAEDGKIALYGIDYKDKPEDAARLLAQLGNPYLRVGVDREGRIAIDFGVYGVPETYVVDKAGRIRYRQVGPISEDDLKGKLLPLLKQLGAAT